MVDHPAALLSLVPAVEGDPRAMAALARQLVGAGRPDAAADLAVRALGLVAPNSEARAAIADLLSRDVPEWHFRIVHDSARNRFYDLALRATVKPGARVLEVGTGSGLLAMLAARAGAGEVVTCEREPAIAAAAREVVARNGLADRIRVLTCDSTELDLERDLGGRVDLLVSEVIANDVLSEGVLPVHEHAARALLAPDSVVVPARVTARVALAHHPGIDRRRLGSIEGFDLSPFERLAKPVAQLGVADPKLALCSAPADLFTFVLAGGGPYPPGRTKVALESAGGPVNAIAQWIRIEAGAGGAVYENAPSPDAASTWALLLYPLHDGGIEPGTGEVVEVGASHDGARLQLWVG